MTVWTRDSEGIIHADGHFGPDGKYYVIFVEDDSTEIRQRVVKLGTVEGGRFEVETLDRVGNIGDSNLEHGVQLVGNEESVWAFWRTKPGSQGSAIIAAQIYPREGEHSLEIVDNNHSTPSFYAALAGDGYPRVAFVRSDGYSLGVVTRKPHGEWYSRYPMPISSADGFRYVDVALACHGDQVSVLYVQNENSVGSAGPYRSRFRYQLGIEPSNFAPISFGEAEFLVQEDFAVVETVAQGIEAEYLEDGELVVAFGNKADSEGCFLTRGKEGGWNGAAFIDFASGVPEDTNLAVGPNGALYFSWRNGKDAISFRSYQEDEFGPVCDVSSAASFGGDLDIHESHLPWMASMGADNSQLQVMVPIDPTDNDGDGLSYFLERAFGSDPAVRDFEMHPFDEIKTYEALDYQTLTFLGEAEGRGDNPYVTKNYEYHIESSRDLVNWSTSPELVVLQSRNNIPGRGSLNIYRGASPIGNQATEYLRIRVVPR